MPDYRAALCFLVLAPALAAPAAAQTASAASPIAIVPLESATPGGAATVSGALQVTAGKALIAANGAVTAGARANTDIALPQRGSLRVCAATTVKLAADVSGSANETPGLMIAFDHGAIETNLTAGTNADTVLTPDFRILMGGPGATRVKIRLADHGDTCVDNPGSNAPYVLVTSVFDGSLYRVQPGQRVMFQHGSTHEVVDQEREPCGCPPLEQKGNDFPLAQSAGMAPLADSGPPAEQGKPAVTAPPLVRNAGSPPEPAGISAQAVPQAGAETTPAQTSAKPAEKKPGFFSRVGHFFKKIFGAE